MPYRNLMGVKYKNMRENDWEGVDVQELVISSHSTFHCTPFIYVNYTASNFSVFPRFQDTCLESENECRHPGVWPLCWQTLNTFGAFRVTSLHIPFTCIFIYVALARGKKIIWVF